MRDRKRTAARLAAWALMDAMGHGDGMVCTRIYKPQGGKSYNVHFMDINEINRHVVQVEWVGVDWNNGTLHATYLGRRLVSKWDIRDARQALAKITAKGEFV